MEISGGGTVRVVVVAVVVVVCVCVCVSEGRYFQVSLLLSLYIKFKQETIMRRS